MRSRLVTAIGLDLVLVGVAVLHYPRVLDQPGSLAYLAGPVVLLGGYVALALVLTGSFDPERHRVLRIAGLVGLATGVVEVVNISVETFLAFSGWTSLAVTAPLLLAPFLVWGVLAGWAAWSTGALRQGLVAALACAMVTMVVAVTYGFAVMLLAPGRLATILVGDPDFVRSGWTDVHAFVLANTFSNGFTHLLGGLVVGLAVGTAGATLGLRLHRHARPGG